MDTKKKRFLKRDGLAFYLKITDNKDLVSIILTRKKFKMAHFIGSLHSDFKSCYLRVTYKPGITNEGVYTNKLDLLNAWRMFSEEDLIKDALTY